MDQSIRKEPTLMSHPCTPTTQRGFTALKLIIVLVIGFSIIAMSASKKGEMFESAKITKSFDHMSSLVNVIYDFRGYIHGINDGNLIPRLLDDGFLPKNIRVTGADDQRQLANEWNGNFSMTMEQATQQILLTSTNLPKKPCQKISKDMLSNDSLISAQGSGNPLTSGATLADITAACTPAAGAAPAEGAAAAAAAPAATTVDLIFRF